MTNENEILYKKALEIIFSDNTVSTSYIQRKLRIGYNTAADLIDRMEAEGIISAPNKIGYREILRTNIPSSNDTKTAKEQKTYTSTTKNTTPPHWNPTTGELLFCACLYLICLFACSEDRFFTSAPIDEAAIAYIPETQKEIIEQGYQETINKYGLNFIKKSNQLLPLAAQKVAKSSQCDKITNVMLSPSKSKHKDMRITVDCNNLARFILNEQEIHSKRTPKTLKERMKENLFENISSCETIIKQNLSHPFSYKQTNKDYSVSNFATTVYIEFTAKNGLGLPLEHVGRCTFNEEGLTNFDIQY